MQLPLEYDQQFIFIFSETATLRRITVSVYVCVCVGVSLDAVAFHVIHMKYVNCYSVVGRLQQSYIVPQFMRCGLPSLQSMRRGVAAIVIEYTDTRKHVS